MRLPFQSAAPKRALRQPAPSVSPPLRASSVAAVFQRQRVSGDYYEFLATGERLVLALLDIAGRRDQAFDIAAQVQETLRARAPALFGPRDVNESSALTELLIEVNRTILRAAGGVRCTPSFLACYHEELGMLTYINAGHLPALVRDEEGVSRLEASGLPLGLFSHTTQDAAFCALRPGAALLLATKGMVEARRRGDEFGMERLEKSLAAAGIAAGGAARTAGDGRPTPAKQLCDAVLADVGAFTGASELEDDMTVVALVRNAVVGR